MIATLNCCLWQMLSKEDVAPVESESCPSLVAILYVLRRLILSPQFFSPSRVRLKDRTLSKSGIWTIALITEGLGRLFLLCCRITSEVGLSMRRDEDLSTGCNFLSRSSLYWMSLNWFMFENIVFSTISRKVVSVYLMFTSLESIYTHRLKSWVIRCWLWYRLLLAISLPKCAKVILLLVISKTLVADKTLIVNLDIKQYWNIK